MKGQISVVVSLVLVALFIAIAVSIYFFGARSSEIIGRGGEERTEEVVKRSEAAIAINKIYKLPTAKNYVEVKNIGGVPLSTDSFSLYLNGSKRTLTPVGCPSEIKPGEECNLSIG